MTGIKRPDAETSVGNESSVTIPMMLKRQLYRAQ